MTITHAQVQHPDDYAYVFRKYKSFLYGVVYHSGVPLDHVEEASGEIFVRMMATDGLARFDGAVTDETNPRRLRAYLASYFSLGARAEISRIRTHEARQLALSEDLPPGVLEMGGPNLRTTVYERQLPHDLNADPLNDIAAMKAEEPDLIDRLLALVTGDARTFVQVCTEHATYPKARAALVEMGWDTLRIRRSVKEARRILRSACTPR